MPDENANVEVAASVAPEESSTYRVWIWRGAAGLFTAFLVARAWRAGLAHAEQLDWALQGSANVTGWLQGLAWHELIGFALFFVLGLLVPPAFKPSTLGTVPARMWQVRLGWWAYGLVAVAVCVGLTWREFPHIGGLFLPLLGYLLGLRLSAALLRGFLPLTVAVAQVALVLVLLAGSVAAIVGLALADAPLGFEKVQLTEADKHQLAQFIRDTRPPAGQPRELRLSETQVDSLLNVAVGRGGADRKARVRFAPSRIDAEASLVLPRSLADQKYLNLHLEGLVSVDNGHLDLICDQLELGRISVPQFVLHALSPVVRGMLLDDPQVRRIVGTLIAFKPEEGEVNAVFQPGSLGRQVVPSLAQLLWERPDVARQSEIYVRHLVQAFDELPPYADRFGLLVQSAFELARERSAEHDPVLENRAAIFALAILLGHQDLEPFVGELLDKPLQAQASRMMGVVTLRNRTDWTRHFMVSAALALLSSESTSDRIGLLKERLDAQEGGSGFSFGDLLADRAGTRFALAATRNDSAARAIQARIAGGFEVGEFFPPAEGLPEGIPEAEFQSQYGGVGGRGYQAIIDEIDRRMARLPKM